MTSPTVDPSTTPTGVAGFTTMLAGIAAVVLALTGVSVAAYVTAGATALAGVVTIVAALRAPGPLGARLWTALLDTLSVLEQVVAVLPKSVKAVRVRLSNR